MEFTNRMELFTNLIVSGEYLSVAILIALTIFLHLPKIVDFYHVIRKKRSHLIRDALSDSNTSEKFKEHLKDEVDIEHFRLIYGIKLSAPMLSAILQLKNRIGESVSFRHILRVAKLFPDIEHISEPSYRVVLGWFDKIFGIYNLAAGFICVVLGLVSGLWFFYTILSNLQPLLFVLSVTGFSFGIFLLNEGSVLISTYHVNKALDCYEKSGI